MSIRSFRLLAALAGIIGVAALGYYYSVPFPLPAPTASLVQVSTFGIKYQNAVYFDTWLQATGALLTVVFFLSLVYLSGAMTRFSGWLTLLASALTLTTALAEGTFALGAILGSINGRPEVALTCLILTYVFVHIFLILPAPVLFLALGAVLLGSTTLPRIFSFLALALGGAFAIVGFVGLFNATAVIVGIFLQIGQELWVVAAAITLIIVTKKAVDTTKPQAIELINQTITTTK